MNAVKLAGENSNSESATSETVEDIRCIAKKEIESAFISNATKLPDGDFWSDQVNYVGSSQFDKAQISNYTRATVFEDEASKIKKMELLADIQSLFTFIVTYQDTASL